jgi:hypothetical protein
MSSVKLGKRRVSCRKGELHPAAPPATPADSNVWWRLHYSNPGGFLFSFTLSRRFWGGHRSKLNGHNYIMNNYMSICIWSCHGERVRSHAEAKVGVGHKLNNKKNGLPMISWKKFIFFTFLPNVRFYSKINLPLKNILFCILTLSLSWPCLTVKATSFSHFENYSADLAELWMEMAETACWDVANIWFGQHCQKKRSPIIRGVRSAIVFRYALFRYYRNKENSSRLEL